MANVKADGAVASKPCPPGATLDLTGQAALVLRHIGTDTETVWALSVSPLGRLAVPAFNLASHQFEPPIGHNAQRLYKTLTGWNAEGDWIEWKI